MQRPTPMVSTITLIGAGVVFVVMAFWGVTAATTPISRSDGSGTAAGQCSDAEKTIQTHIKRKDVTVSVYNSGKRKGLATDVLQRLENSGFRPGAVGNAPEGLSADVAVVYAKDTSSTSAKLVALILGPDTQILPQEIDMGPGVNVVVGDQFKRLDRTAPRSLELPEPIITCVKVD
jgi:hypothetical protein